MVDVMGAFSLVAGRKGAKPDSVLWMVVSVLRAFSPDPLCSFTPVDKSAQ